MSSFNVDFLAEALQSTKVSPSGVSFAGKSLKLDSEDDAKDVVEEINKCKELQYLNLEGNTVGVEASKVIAQALEKHPEFKRALWKDMFTGRLKSEIPKSLQFLGDGLVAAGVRLTELDLSDNAFGPIGVQGLASLLKSPTCYALEELRLNNNGLGITGGKLLASALTECYNSSKAQGKPLALKVFIAGRNRLENEGATALAGVFKMLGSLEEIAMPQNGIYYSGITALSEAFTSNKNLQILNLNDNTIGEKGATAIAKALPNLQNLKEINFGDCLLKTQGSILLAHALKDKHEKLEQLALGYNEIKMRGGLELVKAVANKIKLKKIVLDGNQFGEEGAEELQDKFKEIGKLNIISLEDNEEDSEVEDKRRDESDSDKSEDDSDIDELQDTIPVEDFLRSPTAKNFMLLGDQRTELIIDASKSYLDIKLDNYICVLMNVASLTDNAKEIVAKTALKSTESLYKELFAWSQKNDKTSLVNNFILISMGLIKCEDKRFKPFWNIPGCLTSLKNLSKLNFTPDSTKNTIKVFMERQV